MKKVLLAVVCIISNAVIVSAQLTRQQAWAIALSGMLTEQNRDNHGTLQFDDLTESHKRRYAALLADDWNVHNREELLLMIEQTEHNGHAAALKEIKQIIDNEKDYSILAINRKYHLDAAAYNRLKFVAANWETYQNRTILAWDLGRVIALCRWGYSCEYITKEEAWEKVMYYAKKIQPLYDSWVAYGLDYFWGRLFWAAGFGEDMSRLSATEQLYRSLTGEYGYWRNFTWDIDLDAVDHYPIHTISWVEDEDGFMQYQTNDSANSLKHIRSPEAIDVSKSEIVIKQVRGLFGGSGIYFNYVDDKNYYELSISRSGVYSLSRRRNGTRTVIHDYANNSAIKRGYNVENTIRIAYQGNRYEVYINNVRVSEIRDENGQEGGAYVYAFIATAEHEAFPIISVDLRYKTRLLPVTDALPNSQI
jgi:hypothetical protein